MPTITPPSDEDQIDTLEALGSASEAPSATIANDTAAPDTASAADPAPSAAANRALNAPMRASLAKVDPALVREAARRAVRPLTDGTRRTYVRCWHAWLQWCKGSGYTPFPATEEGLCVYLLSLSKEGLAASSVEQAYIAIRSAHKRMGEPLPTLWGVSGLLSSLKRDEAGRGRPRYIKKAPLMREDLRKILALLPAGPIGVRDRALLLVGWAAALRRTELAALDVSDVVFGEDGVLRLLIKRSKTDQEGVGAKGAITPADDPDECPVRALKAWIEGAGLKDGPLFRPLARSTPGGPIRVRKGRMWSGRIARIVKAYARAANLDPSQFAGHSLRSGFATQASEDGVPLHRIMEVTRHESERVARGYIRNADPAKRAVKLL